MHVIHVEASVQDGRAYVSGFFAAGFLKRVYASPRPAVKVLPGSVRLEALGAQLQHAALGHGASREVPEEDGIGVAWQELQRRRQVAPQVYHELLLS